MTITITAPYHYKLGSGSPYHLCFFQAIPANNSILQSYIFTSAFTYKYYNTNGQQKLSTTQLGSVSF